jgi:hypothetical protein
MTSLWKSRFLMPRHHPKKIGPAGLFSPAESEIWPADQTGKLRTGLIANPGHIFLRVTVPRVPRLKRLEPAVTRRKDRLDTLRYHTHPHSDLSKTVTCFSVLRLYTVLDVLIGRSPAKKAPPFICSRILWLIFPRIHFDFEFWKMLQIWNFGNFSDEYFYDRSVF